MTKNHLKRINAPKQWRILRKEYKFVTRPNPGPHSLLESTSLGTALKYILNLASNTREVKYILTNHEVLVDWRRKKDKKAQVGLFDTLCLPKFGLFYRALLDDMGKIYFKKINEKESVIKISRVVNKTQNKNGFQLNLSDGRNILVDKKTHYAVGDSLLLELPDQKIKSVLKVEKGNMVYFYKGKFAGAIATVEKIEGKTIHCISKSGKFHTNTEYAFAIGQTKPLIDIDSE